MKYTASALLVQLLVPELVAPVVAQLEKLGAGLDWVRLDRLPLPRKVAFAAAKRGDIRGARKVGRRWIARRADVDAWIESFAASEPKEEQATPKDDADAALAALGLRRAG